MADAPVPLNNVPVAAHPAVSDDGAVAAMATALMQSRQTILPKRLLAPGPDAAQLHAIVSAAAAAPAPIRVATVEDDAASRIALVAALNAAGDMRLLWAASARTEALAALARPDAEPPDVLLVDLGLPDGSGLEVIAAARRRWPACAPMVCTIFGDEEHVLAAIEAGLENSGADVDFELGAGGVLEVEFADGSKMIINRHGAAREIWVAARSGGYHFGWDGQSWRNARDGSELYARLSELLSAQTGMSIRLG